MNENGQPILVEFNEDGSEGNEITVPSDYANHIDSLRIISSAEYRFEKLRLEQYREEHQNDLAIGAELMDVQQFQSGTFKLADNQTVMNKPTLAGHVKSVLVRSQSHRIINDPNQLVLLRFSVNLAQNIVVADQIHSVSSVLPLIRYP